MNPEDRHLLDSLAGKLAALQPCSANRLQAETFFRAGEEAAKLQRKPTGIPSWFARVSIAALMLLSSSASYVAGLSQGGTLRVAKARTGNSQGQFSPGDLSQGREEGRRPSQPEVGSGEHADSAESASVDKFATEPGTVSQNSPYIVAAAEQRKLLNIPEWLQLPELSPERYAQMVEARTAPARAKYTVKNPLKIVNPINSILDEAKGNNTESLLRRWLSM